MRSPEKRRFRHPRRVFQRSDKDMGILKKKQDRKTAHAAIRFSIETNRVILGRKISKEGITFLSTCWNAVFEIVCRNYIILPLRCGIIFGKKDSDDGI